MVTSKTRSKSKRRKNSEEKHISTSTTSESDISTDLALSQSSPSSLATLVPTPEDVKDVLNFETVKQLAEFYRAVGWTPAMELQILINIIRTSDNNVEVLRALKDLQTRRAEILRNSGLMVKATRVQRDADGGQTIFSANIVAAALNYNPDLEQKPESKGVIQDDQEEKDTTDTTNTTKEDPLGDDGNARGGDGGNGSDRTGESSGADRTAGTDGVVDGHKPPSGSFLLTGIATRRG